MNRREVIKRIGKAAKAAGLKWEVQREGANHTVYSLDGLRIPISRGSSLDDGYARMVFKECEPKLGKGWWR